MSKTVEFIQQLKDTNAHLAETLESLTEDGLDALSLKQEIRHLQEENRLLKQKLSDAGIMDFEDSSQAQEQGESLGAISVDDSAKQ